MNTHNPLTSTLSAVLLFMSVLVPPGFSAPLALPAAGIAPPSQTKIGIVAAVKGAVKIDNDRLAGRVAQSGEPVYIGDVVSTDSAGTLQILLMDETVFTIGPNSAIVIDKFIYDPASQSGKINAKVVKGVFRFMTGKIAKKQPSDMKVDLPSGSIGVRGTIVAGQTDGNKSTVVLLGPGSRTNTNHRIGQITVGNEVNGKFEEVTVTRPGYGSVIDGKNFAPTIPFQVPAEEVQKITAALEPKFSPDSTDPQDENDGGFQPTQGGDPSKQSGQDRAQAREPVKGLGRANNTLQKLNRELDRSAQLAAANDQTIRDGVARKDELRRIQSGVFHFHQSGAPVSVVATGMSTGYTYSFDMDINFGNRTVGGSSATNNITVNLSPNVAKYQLDTKSFAEGVDSAVFRFDNVTNSGPCTSCSNADILVGLNNRDGVIADNARHTILFNDGAHNVRGEGVTSSRSSS